MLLHIIDKMNKLKMLYDLVGTKGIRVVVPPPTTTTPALTPAPISTVEAFTSAFEVDQLVDVATTLTVRRCPLLQFQRKGVKMKTLPLPRNNVFLRKLIIVGTML